MGKHGRPLTSSDLASIMEQKMYLKKSYKVIARAMGISVWTIYTFINEAKNNFIRPQDQDRQR